MIFLLFVLKPNQFAASWFFVSGLQLKVVTRTLVDKLRFDCRDCLFTDQTTSKWCANDLVALVKDHASNITAFVFVLCAFVDLDCGHVF